MLISVKMNWYNILPTKCIEHPQYMIVMFIRDLFLFHPRVRRTTKRKRDRKKCEAKEDFFLSKMFPIEIVCNTVSQN